MLRSGLCYIKHQTAQSSGVLQSSAIVNLIPNHASFFSEKLIEIPPLPLFAFLYISDSERLLEEGDSLGPVQVLS